MTLPAAFVTGRLIGLSPAGAESVAVLAVINATDELARAIADELEHALDGVGCLGFADERRRVGEAIAKAAMPRVLAAMMTTVDSIADHDAPDV